MADIVSMCGGLQRSLGEMLLSVCIWSATDTDSIAQWRHQLWA